MSFGEDSAVATATGTTEIAFLEDRYELGEILGAGGAGVVYAARDLHLDIDVAVKIMRDEHVSDAGMMARFTREASISSRAMSPHVVKVLGLAITSSGAPCIIYERLVGETLAERLLREGGVSVAVLADIITQTSRALARIHAMGVVHCDVKPDNIFLDAQLGGRFTVKLIDFGVAELMEGDGLLVQGYGGTVEYMAPETLLMGQKRDARADLYALAVVAFECLTGRCPFPGERVEEVIDLLCHGTRPSLSSLRPDLAGPVDDWMERALHPDPYWRFASAKDMAHDLNRALDTIFAARTQLRAAA